MTLRVQVTVALPGRQEVMEVELPEGATVGDAIAACRQGGLLAGLDLDAATAGIWSRQVDLTTPLRDNDRVELYRPLKADAKAMRRARARLKPASPRSRNEP